MATYAPSDMRTRRGIPASPTGSGWSAPNAAGTASSGSTGSSSSVPAWGAAPGVSSATPSWGGSHAAAPRASPSGPAGYGGNWQAASAERIPSDAGDTSKQSVTLRGTFALMLITAICLHADQNLAAPNLSAIAKDFEMTPLQKDTRLGGMVQFGFFLIGGAVSLLVGPLTDQVDRVTLLSTVVLSGAVPSLLMSIWVPSSKAGFFYYLLSRICTGIAIGGSFPVLFSLSADIFPASQRASAAAAISASTNIGAAVGGMMAGLVGPKWGWRVPFRMVAIPALICAALVRVFLVDPRQKRRQQRAREELEGANNPAFNAWMGGADATPAGHVRMEDLDFTKFMSILDVPTNTRIFAQALPGCIPLSCITTFLADYLAVEQGMSVEASTAVTACFGISCLCFAVSGGVFGQRLPRNQLPVLIAATTSFATIPFVLLVNSPKGAVTSSSGRPTMWTFFLALAGGSSAVAGPNIRAMLMNVNEGQVRGTVFSGFTLCDDLGKGLGPSIIVAAEAIFGRRIAYTFAFMLWLLSGCILFSLRHTLPRDTARGGGSLLPMKTKEGV